MNPRAGTLIEVTVRLNKLSLYWYWMKALTRFPAVLGFLLPIALVAYNEARMDRGFYVTLGLSLFLFVGLPWAAILLLYRNTLLKNPVRFTFSDSGISTVLPPVSNFVEWSFASRAIENSRYILIFLKNGFVLLPKDQMSESDVMAVRFMIGEHMKSNARLSN
jgi:hypothetical protein